LKLFCSGIKVKLTEDQRLAVEQFPLLAREYCQFLEQSDGCGRTTLVQEISVRFARLIEVGMRLPSVEPTADDVKPEAETSSTRTEEWKQLWGKLREVLGNLEGYWEVFDPTGKEEPVNGSLANDVAEVYEDLKESLRLLETNASLSDIYWQWRFDFREHWGRHAASALRVLLHVSNYA
jgi:hypothetical protein